MSENSGLHEQLLTESPKKPMSERKKFILMAVCLILVGVMIGFIYFGGGMLFNILLSALWGVNQRTATGTGCFITFVVMSITSLTFINHEYAFSDHPDDFAMCFIGLPFGIIGSMIGARFLVKVSEFVVIFAVATMVLILGIVITVQHYVIKDD